MSIVRLRQCPRPVRSPLPRMPLATSPPRVAAHDGPMFIVSGSGSQADHAQGIDERERRAAVAVDRKLPGGLRL